MIEMEHRNVEDVVVDKAEGRELLLKGKAQYS